MTTAPSCPRGQSGSRGHPTGPPCASSAAPAAPYATSQPTVWQTAGPAPPRQLAEPWTVDPEPPAAPQRRQKCVVQPAAGCDQLERWLPVSAGCDQLVRLWRPVSAGSGVPSSPGVSMPAAMSACPPVPGWYPSAYRFRSTWQADWALAIPLQRQQRRALFEHPLPPPPATCCGSRIGSCAPAEAPPSAPSASPPRRWTEFHRRCGPCVRMVCVGSGFV